MVSIWFKIVDGEYKDSMIFFNQIITQGFQVHLVNEILRTMVSEMAEPIEIEFKSYKQYGNFIMDIFEAINENFEYALAYSKGKKDFSTYEITDVYVLE
jgi:RNAse (barnase) inhibitor barstar